MATPTRTIGPLHLEDLEPHRFEDLVRQLVYDCRNWRALEATGVLDRTTASMLALLRSCHRPTGPHRMKRVRKKT